MFKFRNYYFKTNEININNLQFMRDCIKIQKKKHSTVINSYIKLGILGYV